MRSIGVRELRQQASRYLREAGDPLNLGDPLEPVKGVPLPSAELGVMRKEER